ncbi:MAG: restriction endonuclease [Cyclobacteriaceae bacterium]|nr:restriction endonuclease [Cyclobacteriaceae bacterium]
MSKIEEAQEILRALGLPPAQYNEMAAVTFLALCNIKENDKWAKATRQSLGVTKGIMTFVNENYGKSYAPNTRETFRRQVLHQFVQARVVDYNPDNPILPVNSPRAHYALTYQVLNVVKAYKTLNWKAILNSFIDTVGKLSEVYLKERELNQIPVLLQNGEIIKLSAGKHNEVQAAVIEQFAPRFANGGTLLYLGDTAKKDLFVDEIGLRDLGIPIEQHGKLPDVVIYDDKRKWIFLIEAVTSHGPVSPKRLLELEDLLKNCKVGKVYVTAFPDMMEFKKHSNTIAWETEVWLMDVPDHMIHFNGDRFIGPR